MAKPPTTPPTIAPTGVELEFEATGAADVEAGLVAVPEDAAGAGVDVMEAELNDEVVEVASVLVRVEDGAAVEEGGFWVPVTRLR